MKIWAHHAVAVPPTSLYFAFAELREMKMQPDLEQTLGRRGCRRRRGVVGQIGHLLGVSSAESICLRAHGR